MRHDRPWIHRLLSCFKGIIDYDFRLFAPSYDENYYVEHKKCNLTIRALGNREVKIIRNVNEAGGDMKYEFTIYLERHLAKNIEEFRRTLAKIEFSR